MATTGTHRKKKLYVEFTDSEKKQLEYLAMFHKSKEKELIRSLIKREMMRVIKLERQDT